MNLILERKQYRKDGIFGELFYDDGSKFCVTLEHAYWKVPWTFLAKIQGNRTYRCVRSKHRLHGMTEDFETFQIMDIPPFMGKEVTNCLFHWGCFNENSEGCILLGESFENSNGIEWINKSKITFSNFMNLQLGVETFYIRIL